MEQRVTTDTGSVGEIAVRLVLGGGVAVFVGGVAGVPAVTAAVGLDFPLATALAVAAAVGALAGVGAALAPRQIESLRGPRASMAALGVSGVAAAAVVIGALVDATVFGPGLLAVLVSVLGFFTLRSAAYTHHARRVAGDAQRRASLPEVDRRLSASRQRATYAVLGLVWLVLSIGSTIASGDVYALADPWTLFGAVLGAGFLIAAAAADRDLSLSDAGLLVETPLSARLFEWDEFAGFHRGNQLVLLRREPWAEDVAFDPDAVDEDALAVLEAELPERERRSVPAGDRRGPSGDPGDA